MDLMAKIKEARAARQANGVYSDIPFVKDEKSGTGIDPAPKDLQAGTPQMPVTKLGLNAAYLKAFQTLPQKDQKAKPISQVLLEKGINPSQLGSVKRQPEHLPTSVQTKPAAPQAPVVLKPAAPAGLLQKKEIGEVTLEDFKIDTETFNRGSEKYTEAEVQDLQNALATMRDSFNDVSLLENSLRNIMIAVANNPALRDVVGIKGCGEMVRAARILQGVEVTKASINKAKRAGKKELTPEMESFSVSLAQVLASIK